MPINQNNIIKYFEPDSDGNNGLNNNNKNKNKYDSEGDYIMNIDEFIEKSNNSFNIIDTNHKEKYNNSDDINLKDNKINLFKTAMFLMTRVEHQLFNPKNLLLESHRILTFLHGWDFSVGDINVVSILAKIGYYNTKVNNEIRCIFCNVVQSYPRFLTKAMHDMRCQNRDYNIDLNLNQLIFKITKSSNIYNINSLSYNYTYKPIFENFTLENFDNDKLRETYVKNNWVDRCCKLSVSKLVDGGFSCLAENINNIYGDAVRCNECKLTIHNWYKTDDAFFIHLFYSPECLFIQEMKKIKPELFTIEIIEIMIIHYNERQEDEELQIDRNDFNFSDQYDKNTDKVSLKEDVFFNYKLLNSIVDIYLPAKKALNNSWKRENIISALGKKLHDSKTLFSNDIELSKYLLISLEHKCKKCHQNLFLKTPEKDIENLKDIEYLNRKLCYVCYKQYLREKNSKYKCRICANQSECDQILLPCSHILCSICVKTITNDKNSTFKCPFCRAEVSTTYSIDFSHNDYVCPNCNTLEIKYVLPCKHFLCADCVKIKNNCTFCKTAFDIEKCSRFYIV